MAKAVWFDREIREAVLDQNITATHEVNFGFLRVPEQEKVARVKRHFDTVAGKYDLMNTLLSFGIHYLWKRTAIRLMNPAPGDTVLDVCGGTGDLAFLAARAVGPRGRVYLYDINSSMIRAGRRKRTGHPLEKRIRYILGDAERISLPDNSVDAVMVGFGIRNLTHLERGFREMHRVLKPGGRLMCLEFSKPTAPVFRWLYDLYSFRIMPFLGEVIAGSRQAYLHLPETIRLFPLPDELAGILEEVGLKGVTYHPLTNGIAVVHLGVKPG